MNMSFIVPPEFEKDQYDPGVSLTDKSQAYLIQVPKGFDISRLDGNKFSTRHETNIGREEGPGDLTTVYGLTPYKNRDSTLQLLSSTQGKVTMGGKIKGVLSLTKSYEVKAGPGQQCPSVSSPGGVPMPEGLVARFTPFGAGTPVKAPSNKHKKKSHKRQKSVDSSCNDSPEGSKKKKRKLSTSIVKTEISSPHQHKKHKHKHKDVTDIKADPDEVPYSTSLDSDLGGNHCVIVKKEVDSHNSQLNVVNEFGFIDRIGLDRAGLNCEIKHLKNSSAHDTLLENIKRENGTETPKKKKKSRRRSEEVNVNHTQEFQSNSVKKKKKKHDLTLP